MFGKQEMTALQLRKQTLRLESDLNRLTLQTHCEQLREAAAWVGRMNDARRQVAPWALLLAPLAGVALAVGIRRFSGCAGFLAKALAAAPSLIQLWRTCVSPPNEPK
jgi:hypothetical protein